MKMNRISTLTIGVAAAFVLNSCGEKFLEGEVTSYLDGGTAASLVNTSPEALTTYLDGMWAFMVSWNVTGAGNNHEDFSYMSVLHSTEMMCEDVTFHKDGWFIYDYIWDNRENIWQRTLIDWLTFYTLIAKANEVIDLYIEEPTTPEAKGILGQAYAVRGMSYYYLIQLYQQYMKNADEIDYEAQGVPLRYSKNDGLSEEEQQNRAGRNTVKMVFDQIESDLTKSVEWLEGGYERPSGPSGKNYIDLNVANGLLARYYLMAHKWQEAADAANAARKGYKIMDEKGLQDGFVTISNEEWMWGFDHNSETGTGFASFFSNMSNLTPGYAGLDDSGHSVADWLYNQMSNTDLRKKYWYNAPVEGADGSLTAAQNFPGLPGANYPYSILKFGGDGNYEMDYIYMRASEMVLIEAEAYAHLGDEAKAATVLKDLMEKRDPAWNKSKVTVDDVWMQRRFELIGEGFAFFDFKRLYKDMDRSKSTNHMVGCEYTVEAGDIGWTYQLPYREVQENDEISEKDQNP